MHIVPHQIIWDQGPPGDIFIQITLRSKGFVGATVVGGAAGRQNQEYPKATHTPKWLGNHLHYLQHPRNSRGADRSRFAAFLQTEANSQKWAKCLAHQNER